MKIKENVIREYRLKKGFSQEYVAEYLGISQSQFSKLENGDISFRINELTNLIELLDLNPLEIFDFNEREQIFINSSFSGNVNTTINGLDENVIRRIFKEELKNL